MKIFFVIVLTLTSLTIQGQALVNSTNVWYVINEPNFQPIYYEHYRFGSDTIISSKQYKQVYFSNDSLMSSWWYYGALREDSVKKVYFVRQSEVNERLLYDFNLNVNDTFQICYGSYPVSVSLIDTVTLLNGEQRKRLWFTPGPEVWIDGIGSTMGLVSDGGYAYCITTDGGTIFLNCFSENDTLKYKDTFFNFPCVTVTGNSDIEKYISIDLSPNPFHNYATLTISDFGFEVYNLRIYNAMGRLLQNQIIYNRQTRIDRNSLPNGIYLYQALDTKGNSIIGKFVLD